MWRAFKLVLGIPLIFALTLVQLLLNVFGMLGAIVTTIIAFLMYLMLGMILLFQLQPVNEIAIMSLVATAFFLSPLLVAGMSALIEKLKELIAFWII